GQEEDLWYKPREGQDFQPASHSGEMEKRQTAISSSSERDKGTLPNDTQRSECATCEGKDTNRTTFVLSLSPVREETETDQPVLSLRPTRVRQQQIPSLQVLGQQQIQPHSEPPVCEERDTLRSESSSSETTTDAAS
ncbi:hypothetical protein M9458_057158, partial [Cirrhinus mrigala]